VRLWHLVVGVLVASVVFAGIKALARPSDGSGLGFALGFLALWILSCSVLIFLSLGTRLGDRVTRGLKGWGLARGGVSGFSAFAIGVGVNLVIALSATALGAFLVVNLLLLLFRFSG
jgi:hypothetical protein